MTQLPSGLLRVSVAIDIFIRYFLKMEVDKDFSNIKAV